MLGSEPSFVAQTELTESPLLVLLRVSAVCFNGSSYFLFGWRNVALLRFSLPSVTTSYFPSTLTTLPPPTDRVNCNNLEGKWFTSFRLLQNASAITVKDLWAIHHCDDRVTEFTAMGSDEKNVAGWSAHTVPRNLKTN